MADSKKSYDKGLKSLKKALKELQGAAQHFSTSSAAMDDFPTARHEIADISKEIYHCFDKVLILHTHAKINKIR